MNLKKKITLSLFRQHRKNQIRLHELNYLFWECTLRCNLHCLYCGSDCMQEIQTPDMPLEDFLKVLDSIKPFVNSHKTMIALTGGEPLMRKDLTVRQRVLQTRISMGNGYQWLRAYAKTA
jgi:MoaA/NifB/PqqE/SkfB family radical SAM enzyme